MTPILIMWEGPDGVRQWEALKKKQLAGFLEKLINEGVHPATVLFAYNPIMFHWVWKKYHKGLSDAFISRINEDIYGTDPVEESPHKPVNVRENPEPLLYEKYGWIAPDGRFFGCDYGGHLNLADRIVGKLQDISNSERYLEDNGWAKVLSGSIYRKRYSIGMGKDKVLTDEQLKTLQRMGLEDSYGVSYFLQKARERDG